MIKDLIVRLMEEATQESEHKGWCDTELGTNKQTREDKSEDVDMLVAKKDQLTADIAKLSDQIAGISDDIAEIDAASPRPPRCAARRRRRTRRPSRTRRRRRPPWPRPS